jgi:hypothetical protein
MPKSQLHHEVLHKFIEKLKSEETFDSEMAEKLHKVLTSDDKVTPDILVSILCKEDIAK